MDLESYFFVFVAAFVVDLMPFFGPPAWTVMVFFQIKYNLDIWTVLFIGVAGSALGRYCYSLYIPFISDHFLNQSKKEDLKFIGQKLNARNWKMQFFVFLYTAMPLPSAPLFTAAGISRMNTLVIMPAFFLGKFLIDTIMVHTGEYVAESASDIASGLFSWKSIIGAVLTLLILSVFLFIDWRKLLQDKKFTLNFKILK
ncbi:MAG: hypothetical protein C5B52_09825 [Bacteroidetes bacterium]|nr:MAG: hypothetical protein C5B52_09825 [Bacteroidota bacterium]